MPADLVTLTEYKAYAGITSPTQDTAIKTIIPKASALAKTICKRTFIDYVNDAKIEVFSGGVPKLQLSEYPVLSVSSVEYSADYGNTYTALTEFVDYVVDREDECISCISSSEFPKAVNAYKVTYTAGFEEVPEDLKIAVMDLITYYLKNDMAVKSQRDAGSNTVQVEYITKNTLPSHISRVFDQYIAYVN